MHQHTTTNKAMPINQMVKDNPIFDGSKLRSYSEYNTPSLKQNVRTEPKDVKYGPVGKVVTSQPFESFTHKDSFPPQLEATYRVPATQKSNGPKQLAVNKSFGMTPKVRKAKQPMPLVSHSPQANNKFDDSLARGETIRQRSNR